MVVIVGVVTVGDLLGVGGLGVRVATDVRVDVGDWVASIGFAEHPEISSHPTINTQNSLVFEVEIIIIFL